MTEKKQCGINYTIEALQGRWQPRIIFWLGFRTMTGDELLQLVPGIDAEKLTQGLAKLQNLRVVNPVCDKEDKYSLTDTGQDLRNVMTAMAVWGRQEMDDSADEVSAKIVEPDAFAGMYELVKYNQILDNYL